MPTRVPLREFVFCWDLEGFPKGRRHAVDTDSDLWHEESQSGCSHP